MFSVARHRLALPMQFVFLLVNAFGLLLGIVYNSRTPDLYENNVHHKIGWIATWVASAQALMGLVFAYSGRRKSDGAPYERVGFLPVATESHEHQSYPTTPIHQYRWSGDSGQGTERSSSSLASRQCSPERSSRRMNGLRDPEDFEEKPEDDDDNDNDDYGNGNGNESNRGIPGARFFRNGLCDRFLSKRASGLPQRVLSVMDVIYVIIERTILILGFIALVTGGVTYGGIFVSYS